MSWVPTRENYTTTKRNLISTNLWLDPKPTHKC